MRILSFISLLISPLIVLAGDPPPPNCAALELVTLFR